ncbi:hypothetical protein L7F22_044309 [Adiantum nelumboides]|nr:hypothetical protein [Adiantum nelumboides]
MGVALSIIAFPVLTRILAEKRLLTTDVGQMAMVATAVNDVVAWSLLAFAVALSGTNTSLLVSLWVLLCGFGSVGWQEDGFARPALESADRCGPIIDFVAIALRSHAKCTPTKFSSEEGCLYQEGCQMSENQFVLPKKDPYLKGARPHPEDFAESELDSRVESLSSILSSSDSAKSSGCGRAPFQIGILFW